MFSIKRVRFMILTRKGMPIIAIVRWQQQTRYVYILRSKRGKTPEMFSIKRVRFVILTRKGISIIAIARWQQQTRYVYILRSKRGKTPEMFSIKRVLLGRCKSAYHQFLYDLMDSVQNRAAQRGLKPKTVFLPHCTWDKLGDILANAGGRCMGLFNNNNNNNNNNKTYLYRITASV